MSKATPVYLAVMLEIERRRQACGISMDEMSELMGTAERAYSKMLYSQTPSGRVAGWDVLQKAVDVLFVDGFKLTIDRANTGILTTVGTKAKILNSAANYNRRTYREMMADLAKRGLEVRLEKIANETKTQRKKRVADAKRAIKTRWRIAKAMVKGNTELYAALAKPRQGG